MLTDPGSSLSVQRKLEIFGGKTWTEPSEVRELKDGQRLGFEGALGIDFVVSHARGPYRGVGDVQAADVPDSTERWTSCSPENCCSPAPSPHRPARGDSRRSSNRSPGRAPAAGRHHRAAGHGPQTTIRRERASNPFLRGLRDAGSARPGCDQNEACDEKTTQRQ